MKYALMVIGTLLGSIFACQAKKEMEPITPTPLSVKALREQTQERLMEQHILSGSYPVTLTPEREPEHTGEGILWWGVAQLVLPTYEARRLWDGVADSVYDNGGGIVRVVPLGEYADGRQITIDGGVGFYLGVAAAVVLHGGEDYWRPVFEHHLAYLKTHGDELYAGTAEIMPPGFDLVRDLTAHRLGLAGEPHKDRARTLGVTASSFISSAYAQRQACYPANLSHLTILGLNLFGWDLDGLGRGLFCEATKAMDIPTADHYCGRKHISKYVETFIPHEWEFRHQRCGNGSGPDGHGALGFKTPGLDVLLGIFLGYKDGEI